MKRKQVNQWLSGNIDQNTVVVEGVGGRWKAGLVESTLASNSKHPVTASGGADIARKLAAWLMLLSLSDS